MCEVCMRNEIFNFVAIRSRSTAGRMIRRLNVSEEKIKRRLNSSTIADKIEHNLLITFEQQKSSISLKTPIVLLATSGTSRAN